MVALADNAVALQIHEEQCDERMKGFGRLWLV
jgi:hypothetical protein